MRNLYPVPDRRVFIKKLVAGVIGAILGLVPLGAGLAVFLDPLRHKAAGSTAVRVTTLEAIPADGIPRKFPVLAPPVDAVNKSAAVPPVPDDLPRTTAAP